MVATARMASSSLKSLARLVLSAQSTALLAGEAVDVDHPQPDLALVVELVDGLFHVAELRKPFSAPAVSVT